MKAVIGWARLRFMPADYRRIRRFCGSLDTNDATPLDDGRYYIVIVSVGLSNHDTFFIFDDA